MLSLAAAIGFRLALTTPMADLQPPEPVAAKVLQTGGASEGDTLPLVIALHGRGGDPGSMASVLARLDVQARVVVPQAPLRSGKGWAWFRPRARAVDQERLGDAVRTAGDDLASLVDDVVAQHPTCGGVTVVGFSQGGMVALAYAGAHPETVDQVVAIGAWVPEELQPSSEVRVTLLHGEDDRRVPYRWAREMVQRLGAGGGDAEMQSYAHTGHRPTQTIRRAMRSAVADAVRAEARTCTAAS